ncbi:hypothetical protein DENSPDRAFT_929135 [Dentipellis sp. KUC8613]|nr:hypothetical protein DENSPDRAFT_929135 [Dentipellis sp. KUC8613]
MAGTTSTVESAFRGPYPALARAAKLRGSEPSPIAVRTAPSFRVRRATLPSHPLSRCRRARGYRVEAPSSHSTPPVAAQTHTAPSRRPHRRILGPPSLSSPLPSLTFSAFERPLPSPRAHAWAAAHPICFSSLIASPDALTARRALGLAPLPFPQLERLIRARWHAYASRPAWSPFPLLRARAPLPPRSAIRTPHPAGARARPRSHRRMRPHAPTAVRGCSYGTPIQSSEFQFRVGAFMFAFALAFGIQLELGVRIYLDGWTPMSIATSMSS